MKEVATMNNELKKDQKGIELANVEYWSHIMCKQAIYRGDLACITCNQRVCENALHTVISTIPNDAKMSNKSKETLGLNKSPSEFLTTQDLLASIKSLKLNKSPGPDGLPIEFYELICEAPDGDHKLAEWLKAIFVQSYRAGMLPSHMRKSQIRLIYKKETEEDKKYPKNYRPIALLNVDYKILSKTLANILVDTLPDIINEDQFCMKNRFIGDLIQQIIGIANYQRAENKSGFLAMLDFEKAFDSVNHEFTFKIMEAFGIPKKFIKWSSLAFIDTQACCIINGKRSKYFDLPGGGRQGDNLYPLIFTIVVQDLNHLIHDTNS